MTRRPSRVLSIALLTATFVLTGCGNSDTPTSGPSSSSNPATGTTPATTTGATAPATGTTSAPTDDGTSLPGGEATGKGNNYSVTAPEGWGVATDQAGTGSVALDLLLVSSKKVSKFSNTLAISTAAGDSALVEQQLEKGRTEMADAGREVTDADDVQIAGVTARGFTTKYEREGIRVTLRSYGMARDGKVYLLTLSSSQDDAANALGQFQEITGSWKWT